MTDGAVQIFTSSDGQARLEVTLDRETVWLSQAQMGQLFGTTPENVLMHLRNVFNDEELVEQATTKEFLVVREEGSREVRRRIKHYNLDAIISVGYRVSSRRATQFRQWATQVLKEHLVHGYTLVALALLVTVSSALSDAPRDPLPSFMSAPMSAFCRR